MPVLELIDTDVPGAGSELGFVDVSQLSEISRIYGVMDSDKNILVYNAVDPDSNMVDVVGTTMTVYDSLHPSATWMSPAGTTAPAITTDLNGKPTFSIPASGGVSQGLNAQSPNANLPDPNSWSLGAVIEPDEGAGDVIMNIFGIGSGPAVSPGQLYPNLSLAMGPVGVSNRPNLIVQEGGTTTIRAASSRVDALRTGRNVVLVTFDINEGFRFFINGGEVPNTLALDVRPLTHLTSAYLTNRGGSTYFYGKTGIGFRFSKSLGTDALAGARRRWFEGMMAYYGVSA